MRMLAIYPEVQQKLFAELNNEFTSYAEITADNSTSLPYANAVVNEGLRCQLEHDFIRRNIARESAANVLLD
jgi:cytochrome P450